MAKAFQNMLERFGLTEKILSFNADNATANDKQTTKLSTLDNSFEEQNRARCFNHTVQLSAKTLLTPFNTALSGKAKDSIEIVEGDDEDQLVPDIDEEEGNEEDVDEEKDDEDDGIDELEQLSDDERKELLEGTAAVRETVTKVCTRVHDHETEDVSVRDHETEDVSVLTVCIPAGSATFFRHN
jgi:hypothetical protein